MLSITPIPAFSDNYLWLITQAGSTDAYIVDPGDGKAVRDVLQQKQLSLAGILITHRHYDHIDGIRFLLEHYQTDNRTIPVYGPASAFIPQVTHKLYHDDTITLFQQYTFTTLKTPGHTLEHISYFSSTAQSEPVLFCGDTLFAGGCGRVNDNKPEYLYQSLCTLAQLPDNTQVYCTHEYTLANLAFAQAVEPNNSHIAKRIDQVKKIRSENLPSLPSSILIEKHTNPFIRIANNNIRQAVFNYSGKDYSDTCERFIALRLWKNKFK